MEHHSEFDLSDRHILLAEDGDCNRRLIEHMLGKTEATVVLVENGQLAIDAFAQAARESNPFDLVLMDMEMPVLDGYAAAAILRERGWDGPVIALTARDNSDDRTKCLEAGCSDYVRKPFDSESLIGAICRNLGLFDAVPMR